MFASKFFTRLASVATILLLALSNVQPAYAAPPSNDNFADAQEITLLPFSGSANNIEATTESGEPFGCFSPRTVWYKFTPPTSGFFTVNMNGSSFFDTILNVWRAVGSGLGGLSLMQCTTFGGSLLLHLEGGTTYYFQAGDNFTGGGDLVLNFQEIPAPQPVANFSFFPGDASQFDTVTFCSGAFDPGNVGIESIVWNFGDGATSTANCAQHQYAADGDYPAQHTVTTFDGRSASSSQVVQIRTRDIAITKLSIPQTSKINQTKSIGVEVSNKRYSDYVQVVLYKGLPGGGEQQIGVLTIFVPARANRPTIFRFSYTFTSSDAAVGKVTFRAVATLVNGRDALPADNTAIGTTLITGSSYPNP